MALTFNDIPAGPTAIVAVGTVPGLVPGSRKQKRIRCTGDNNYPTGGYAPPSLGVLGFSEQIDYCDLGNEHPGATASYWLWNTVTQKLQLIVTATGAELGNGQNASAAFVDCIFTGF